MSIVVIVTFHRQRDVVRARLRRGTQRKVSTRDEHGARMGEPERVRIRLPKSGVSRRCRRVPVCKPFVKHRAAHMLKVQAGDARVGGGQRERTELEGSAGDAPPDLVTPDHGLVPDAGPAALERACEYCPAVRAHDHFCVYLARRHIGGRRAGQDARFGRNHAVCGTSTER